MGGKNLDDEDIKSQGTLISKLQIFDSAIHDFLVSAESLHNSVLSRLSLADLSKEKVFSMKAL